MTLPALKTAATQTQISGGEIAESVIVKGDLSKLSPAERAQYYTAVCHSIGVNPLTQPLAYVQLGGKTVLYALRNCTDQLRKIHSVSVEIVSRELADDILTIHVRAKMPDGRSDEDLGAVPFSPSLKGEARANAELKAITKAKRRATLSICGLGWLDETEVEDIPGAKRENPHVTKPEDVIGEPIEYDEQGEPIDNIPSGDPGIERMSKSMARPEYANLQAEIRNSKSLDDLKAWGEKNANRTASLPLDWQDYLRAEFRTKRDELRAAQ